MIYNYSFAYVIRLTYTILWTYSFGYYSFTYTASCASPYRLQYNSTVLLVVVTHAIPCNTYMSRLFNYSRYSIQSSRRDLFTWVYYSTPLRGGILPLFGLALSNTDYSVDCVQITLSVILVGLVFSNFTHYFCNVSRETLFTAVSQRSFTCYLHCTSKCYQQIHRFTH